MLPMAKGRRELSLHGNHKPMEIHAGIREAETVREMEAARQQKEAHESLMNWGRYCADNWLEHNLLHSILPTSEGYLAPVVAYDDPEPPRMPIDHHSGMIAEHVVVSIGCEVGGFDYYRALTKVYTRLVFVDCTQEERFKRLSKHLKCSYPGAERMLSDAQKIYWDRRQTMDGLIIAYKRMKRVEML